MEVMRLYAVRSSYSLAIVTFTAVQGAALMAHLGFDAENAYMRPAPQTSVLVYVFVFAGYVFIESSCTFIPSPWQHLMCRCYLAN